MKLPLSEIIVGERTRKDMGDLKSLASSMRELGLLQPVVVTTGNHLIAGERRLRAAEMLGWDSIEATVAESLQDLVKCIKAETDENTCRKDFTPSEAVRAGERIAEALKPKQEQAKLEGRKKGGEIAGRGRPKEDGTEKVKRKLRSTNRAVNKTSSQVAEAVGMKPRTYEKAAAVVEAAEAEPEKYGKFAEHMDRTGKVDGPYKQMKNQQAAESIAAEPPVLEKGPFRVIVVDPPWSYDARGNDKSHRAANPYPSMRLDQIKALEIGSIAHADCVLWLWTTNAHLREAFSLVDHWGFAYKTILTWGKDRFGTGDWLRGQTEHCLMAVKGKPTITLTNQTTLITGKLREHSRKPDEFYTLVETLCPAPANGRYELFQREQRKGWTLGYGNEKELFAAVEDDEPRDQATVYSLQSLEREASDNHQHEDAAEYRREWEELQEELDRAEESKSA